jgi:hypothetical protein
MRKFFSVAALILAFVISTGCDKRCKDVFSPVMHEYAKVVKMEHYDAYTTMVPILIDDIISYITISHPERNIISFHGEVDFTVDNQQVYSRFRKGDVAKVAYREVYTHVYEDLDRDGKKEETEVNFKKYQFVDAAREPNPPAEKTE